MEVEKVRNIVPTCMEGRDKSNFQCQSRGTLDQQKRVIIDIQTKDRKEIHMITED